MDADGWKTVLVVAVFSEFVIFVDAMRASGGKSTLAQELDGAPFGWWRDQLQKEVPLGFWKTKHKDDYIRMMQQQNKNDQSTGPIVRPSRPSRPSRPESKPIEKQASMTGKVPQSPILTLLRTISKNPCAELMGRGRPDEEALKAATEKCEEGLNGFNEMEDARLKKRCPNARKPVSCKIDTKDNTHKCHVTITKPGSCFSPAKDYVAPLDYCAQNARNYFIKTTQEVTKAKTKALVKQNAQQNKRKPRRVRTSG